MPGNTHIDDDLASVVRYALETTRTTAVCPFHPNVTIRVGDDATETHAYIRAHKTLKSDGATWDREVLLQEFKRQLDDAADGACPDCAGQSY
jgi:LmbE family N-acetylglucosaminyl deacetylase